MPKEFVRLTPALFEKVIKSWQNEAAANELVFESGWAPSVSYARTIVENPKPRYGIYVLATVDTKGVVRPPYDRFVHVNHKLPNTPHSEVRFVWTVPSPAGTARREATTAVADQIADYVVCAMKCAEKHHKSKALRLYLPDSVDHQAAKLFARVVALMRDQTQPDEQSRVAKLEVRVVPQWLILKQTA